MLDALVRREREFDARLIAAALEMYRILYSLYDILNAYEFDSYDTLRERIGELLNFIEGIDGTERR